MEDATSGRVHGPTPLCRWFKSAQAIMVFMSDSKLTVQTPLYHATPESLSDHLNVPVRLDGVRSEWVPLWAVSLDFTGRLRTD